MSAKDSTRERAPPTRLLEEQESDLLDTLVELSLLYPDKNNLTELQEAVRQKKAAWERYSLVVSLLVPRLENDGHRAEAGNAKQRMRRRRQTLRKEIQDLNQLRADLDDQVSTFSGSSTLVSNKGRLDANAVPPSVDLTDRTGPEFPDQTPSTSPSPSEPTQSSVDAPSVVQSPTQPAKTVTWRDPTTDDCPIARPLSDNVDPHSRTNTTILHPTNSAPNTIPHSPS